MFRLASTVTLFLLCIALTHGAPRYSDTDYCDGRLCNATCMKEAEHSHDRGVYGKCDAEGACHCYHKEMCAADTCKNMCEVKHGSEENLRHECANDVCTCTWTKRCDPAACETACQKVYVGKPHTQSRCEKTLCRCSWHGVTATIAGGHPLISQATDARYASRPEQTIRTVESNSFSFEKELEAPAAAEAVQKPAHV
ncbi:uncharacterized protein LOC142786501 [Rhipicephalus microplus]|uniref:uncharacterized protein LOC142786501 n=1 Tax=Rhipicephalus microplus TaxID=6941 RepID=UPI0023765D9F